MRIGTWILAFAASVTLTAPCAAQGAPDSQIIILRSPEELASLQALLANPAAWGQLRTLGQKWALWDIGTRPASEELPDGAVLRLEHDFYFATPHSRAGRRYRKTFRVTCLASGDHEVETLAGRFVRLPPRSRRLDGGRPNEGSSAQDPTLLSVLREFLAHERFLGDLPLILQAEILLHVRTRRDAAAEERLRADGQDPDPIVEVQVTTRVRNDLESPEKHYYYTATLDPETLGIRSVVADPENQLPAEED